MTSNMTSNSTSLPDKPAPSAEELERRKAQSRRDRNRAKRARRRANQQSNAGSDYETEADYIVDRMAFPFR